MIQEFLKEGSVRELLLDGAAISALVVAALSSGLYLIFGAPLLSALDAAILALATIPLACFFALVAMSRIDDQDFIVFLKASGTYNTLELQFAYYERVCILATVMAAVHYVLRALAGATALATVSAVVSVTFFAWSIGGTYLSFQTLRKYRALRADMVEILGPKK